MIEDQQPARGQPVVVLSEESQQMRGRDAQTANIAAGKAVAESVETTLGPRGMDKMLVSSGGEVVLTNDGATILSEMEVEHPAAQMLVEVAETQKEEFGDGTTTAAVLAGQLLAQAEDLVEDDVHPRTIVEGYHDASCIAREAIDEQVADTEIDDDLLRTVAAASMTGKGTGHISAEALAERVVDAVRRDQDDSVGRDHIRLATHSGASGAATECRDGVVVVNDDQNAPIRDDMPRSVEDATIAVLDEAPDVYNTPQDKLNFTEYDHEVNTVEQFDAIKEGEKRVLQEYVDVLTDADVDVVFNRAGIHGDVAGALAKEGILVLEPLMKNAKDIVRATGARRVASISELEADDLGKAEYVGVEKFGDDYVISVEGGVADEMTSVYIRGSTKHVVAELERVVDGAIDVVTATKDGGVVPGGGSSELAIAKALRSEAASVEGRKQLAVEAFADAVEALPRALAANAGLNPVDALVDLRTTFDAEGTAGVVVDGSSATVADPAEAGVFDSAAVKRKTIESATEAATMIARIDDVITAESSR
jgi:chaperonin GroEL (HSP60 family)